MTPITAGTTPRSGGRPLALVAEDDPRLRENTVRMLDRRGIAAISVESLTEAKSALPVSPHVDVALLDIHLDPDRESADKSGLDIAKLLRAASRSTRIIGYSGHFREESLSRAELDLFDETRAKGRLTRKDHEELWDLCAVLARRGQDDRLAAAHEELDRLRRLYESELSEIDVLRRLQMDSLPAGEYTAEGALGLAGFRIRIVQVKTAVGASRPFVIWVQHAVEDGVNWTNVEVYDHPELYAAGRTEREAAEALAEFLSLTRADLEHRRSVSPADKRLRMFLRDHNL